MKLINSILAVLPMVVVSCGDKSASNPETISRDSFNPPGFAFTTTGDGEIKIHFTTANVEDDFKGYNIYGVKKKLSDVKAKIKVPTAEEGVLSGIPRCKSNTEVFEMFGFAKNEEDCEGVEETGGTDSTTGDSASGEKVELPATFLKCEEAKSSAEAAKLSLPITPVGDVRTSTKLQTCTVKEIYDPTTKALTAIKNGSEMTFMIVAVQGDDLDEISWTSNFFEDASSDNVFSDTLKIAQDKYIPLTFTFGGAKTTGAAGTAQSCSTKTLCKVLSENAESKTANTVYIARDGSSDTFEQRIFISAAADGQVAIRPRGSQTRSDKVADYDKDQVFTRIPGDEPVSSFVTSGTTFAVYGNQVFDLRFKEGTNTRYGKLIVESVSYAGDETTDASVKVTVIIQPGNGIMHYLQ